MSDFNKNEVIAYNKGYRITEDGVAIGLKKEKIGYKNKEGYVRIKIRDESGNNINVNAHRLQAYQKFGEKIYDKGIVVRHLDGNPSNNSHDNIDIGTMSDNMMDRDPEERRRHAIHASSFAKKHNHESIIQFYNKCNSYNQTMDEFGISSKGTLHHILNKNEKDFKNYEEL